MDQTPIAHSSPVLLGWHIDTFAADFMVFVKHCLRKTEELDAFTLSQTLEIMTNYKNLSPSVINEQRPYKMQTFSVNKIINILSNINL